MVFLHNVHFDATRLVKKSLQTFYGIGPSVCRRIMARYGIHDTAKVGSLSEKQVIDLNAEMSGMKLDNELRREIRGNIYKLWEIGCYRGKRHAMGLPVRGQGTRTQINTARRLNRLERR